MDGYDFFPSTPEVTEVMLRQIEERASATLREKLEAGDVTVLEPSAGDGKLVDALRARYPNIPESAFTLVEIDSARVMGLRRRYPEADIVHENFVGWSFDAYVEGRQYDLVLMNPPLSNEQGPEHIDNADDLQADNGLLVSVVLGRRTGRSRFAAKIHQRGGGFAKLPAGAFAPSGTTIYTAVCVLPARAE